MSICYYYCNYYYFLLLLLFLYADYVVAVQAQTDPNNRFSYNSDPVHTITLYCCDRVECVSSTVTVYLQPNNPPVINNLPGTVYM